MTRHNASITHACWMITYTIAAVSTSTGFANPLFLAVSHTNREVYRVDANDLQNPSLIGPVSVGTDLSGAVFVDQSTIYTFDRDANLLITYDTSAGSVQSSVMLDQDAFVTRRGFDRSPEGILYGVLPGMELRTINPLTGQTTLVAAITGAPRVEAIAFSPDGTLYAVGSLNDNSTSEHLFTLNTTTGLLTSIGAMSLTDADTLAYAGDGFLYTTDALTGTISDLWRIDPNTADVVNLGSTGVAAVNGLVAVPEPSTFYLLLIGIVATFIRKLRQ